MFCRDEKRQLGDLEREGEATHENVGEGRSNEEKLRHRGDQVKRIEIEE